MIRLLTSKPRYVWNSDPQNINTPSFQMMILPKRPMEYLSIPPSK